jgi:hypothetical protein
VHLPPDAGADRTFDKQLMKTVLLILLMILLFSGSGITQPTDTVQRYELSEITLSQPELLGKVGKHYMLLDRKTDSGKGVPLYILDSNKQFEKKVYLPAYAAAARRHITGDQLRLTYMANRRVPASSPIYILQVNEDGIFRNLAAIQPDSSAFPPSIIGNNTHLQLIYSFYSLKDSGIFFTGMLVDSTGASVKTLAYKVDFDPDFSQQPQVILDSKGNIHVIITERLSSYRLSSAVSINTIPFHGDELTSETFRFERIKFNRLILSDNPGQQMVQLQGFYYDGQIKNTKKGLVSLQLPYERGKQPNNKFNLFPDHLRVQLRKHLVHLHRKDDVMNTLSLNNFVTEKGATLLSFWVRDVAAFEQQGEFETDQNREKLWANMAKNMKLPEARVKDMYDRWLNGANTSHYSLSPQSGTASISNTGNFIYESSTSPAIYQSGRTYSNGGSLRGVNEARKRNLVNFRLATDGKLADLSIISDRFLSTEMKDELEAFAFPLLYENGLGFAKTGWMDRDEAFYVILPQGVNDPVRKPLTQVMPLSTFVTAPIKTGDNTYGWLMKQAPKDGGGISLLEYTFR